MNILVTGGAGFIGSAVVRELILHSEHNVVNVDKLTYAGNLESLAAVSASSRYVFEKADINDRKNIAAVFQKYKPQIIMHLAAESHVDRSIDLPDDFILTNIHGTYNLLEVARSYFHQLADKEKQSFRFHHISTDEVYGDLARAANGDAALFTETTAYAPSSPYSASKAASDHLVRAWHRTFELPVLLTNCSNNYGPYQFPEKLIPHILLSALQRKPLPVYGDGGQIRDWLYVEDHARALVLAATQGKIGETYNIGGHNEKKNLEVVETLCRILDDVRPAKTPYADLITFVEDRPGHDRRYAIDASKIKGDLGWVPQETFETGLYKTVRWYLENETWWQNVLNGTYKLGRIGGITN